MTSPALPIPLANAAPTPGNAVASANTTAARDKRDGFAQTLARQQDSSAPPAATSATATGARTARAGKDTGDSDATLTAQTPPADTPVLALPIEVVALPEPTGLAPALPQQALEIASQAADLQAQMRAMAAAAATPQPAWPQATAAEPAPPAPPLAPADLATTPAMPAMPATTGPTLRLPPEPAPPQASGQTLPAAAALPPGPGLTAVVPPAQPATETFTAATAPRERDTPDTLPAMGQAGFLATTPSPPIATAPTPAMQLALPVGASQWGNELGREVTRFSVAAQHGTHTAELRLDPPDLGPLRVTLSLHDGVASASFVSAHANVRQAVESALPQLQQALAEAGIALGQADVGGQEQAPRQQQGNGAPAATASGSTPDTPGAGPQAVAAARKATHHDGLVNTYA